MFTNIYRILITLALPFLWILSPANADEIVIVANEEAELPADPEAARVKLRQMFLKQSRTWPNGVSAKPFARGHTSIEQEAFESVILGMDKTELEAYWLRLKQTRGETPPKAIGADRILLRQISRKPGTFGAMNRSNFDAAETDGTKIIYEINLRAE